MIIIQSSLQISASVERVWSLLTEPEQQKKWIAKLVANRLADSEASHVGAKVELVTRHKKILTTYDGVMTHYNPLHEIGIRFTGGKIKAGYSVTIRYWLAAKDAGTNLKYRAEITAEKMSPFTAVKLVLLKPYYQAAAKKKLKKLKLMAEGNEK